MTRTELEQGIFEAGMITTKAFEQTDAALEDLGHYLASALSIEIPEFSMTRTKASSISRRRYRCSPFRYEGNTYLIACDVVLGDDFRFSQLLHAPFIVWQVLQASQERSLGNEYSYELLPHTDPQEEQYTPGDWESLPDRNGAFVLRSREDRSTRLVLYTPWTALLREFQNSDTQNLFSLLKDIIKKFSGKSFHASSLNIEQCLIILNWDEDEQRFDPVPVK